MNELNAPQEIVLSQEKMLEELRQYCNRFIQRSAEWRKNSYETQWRRWQRNSDSIFDPEISRKKEPWQSRAFVPITASHRENAQAQLFKTEVGPRPPLEIKARPTVPQEADQAENIRDLILREREKTRFEIERNKVIEDKTTYGSGFARMRFEEIVEDRQVQVPDFEQVSVWDPTSLMRAMTGQRRIIGHHMEMRPQIIYRGVRYEHISIWDVFPDPKALKIKGSSIGYRFKMTYGDIVKGVEEGYYLPGAAERLKGMPSEEIEPEDKKAVESDRAIADSAMERTDYGALHTFYEIYGRIPKKWVLINGEPIDNPEKLVPARVIFHRDCVVAVEFSDQYDGEPPIYKDDYMPVAGQFYGRGIPEMLKDVQAICNEEVNQRLDSKSITLNPMFAVIERAVVDANDFISKTGGVIRLKASAGITDIRQAFQRIDMGTIDRAAFLEPQEWERWAQERTSISRTAMGTAGQVSDANKTLGGQQLMLQALGEKMAFLGMLSEFGAQYEVNRAFWKLIYQNYNQDDVILALGPVRANSFVPMSPEQVENDYQYICQGIFTMENKSSRAARLAAIHAQFKGAPFVNDAEFYKAELITADEDPTEFTLGDAEQQQIQMLAQQIAKPMALQIAPQMAKDMMDQELSKQSQEAKIQKAIEDKLEKQENAKEAMGMPRMES